MVWSGKNLLGVAGLHDLALMKNRDAVANSRDSFQETTDRSGALPSSAHRRNSSAKVGELGEFLLDCFKPFVLLAVTNTCGFDSGDRQFIRRS